MKLEKVKQWYGFRLIILGIAGCLGLISSTGVAQSVSFTDGAFNNVDWTVLSIDNDDGGTASGSQTVSGGNPGSYRRVVNNIPANPGTKASVLGFHGQVNSIYDPSTILPIDTIDFSIDYRNISTFGQGQRFGFAIKQGNNIYVDGSALSGTSSPWQSFDVNGTTVSDFGLTAIVGNPLMTADFGQNPDFGVSGLPIELGFYSSNTSSGATLIVGYDNWTVTIHQVPEPTVLALIGVGSLVFRRRRRC